MKININVFDGIKYTIDLLLKKNLINDETTIIIPIIDLFEDILKIKDCYKNKLIFVLYQRDAINVPFDTNIELITIPEQFKIEEIYNMASDIKEEYDNAYLLDLSNDKEYINYYFCTINLLVIK